MKIHLLSLCFLAASLGAQTIDYKKAPNSYIFDIDLANSQNYGGIDIPVKKAYEMWANYNYLKNNGVATPIPLGIQTASLYWEDVPGLINNVSVENGGSPEDSKIHVKINRGKGKGNAVVAFKVNGTIFWSWHIWVTDNPENGVSYTQGFETDVAGNPITVKYMDRNLGASSNNFLGNDWQKTTGLLYEWGRKDPFPGLVNKDLFFYEISGEVGKLKHKTIDAVNTIPVKLREFDQIEKNMRFSVQNPITYIINSDNGNWFSRDRYKANGAGNNYKTWDLWSDNFKGGDGNANSSNTAIKADSRSYELKSELDPCPNGWRVPSYYGRVTMNNNLGPWGRKNSGGNDDITSASSLSPDQQNPALHGVKVYPGLGIDFTNAQDGARNLGMMPMTGNYEYYPNVTSPNVPVSIIYQDENSDGGLWSATYGYDGVRFLGLISDPGRFEVSSAGKHGIFVNQTISTKSGLAVRCMRDPNISRIGDFPTQYFQDDKQNFTEGLNNANTYLVNGKSQIEIPVNKAFSVYNQILTDRENLPADELVSKILWTDNTSLITSISMKINSSDPRLSTINVQIAPNQYGNAVISLHNKDTKNPAYWSWHIWNPRGNPTENPSVYKTENEIPVQYNIINATKSLSPLMQTTFMDRNLGAVDVMPETYSNETSEQLRNSVGLQYQWGRKDPMPNFTSAGDGKFSELSRKYFVGYENEKDPAFMEIDEQAFIQTETRSYSSYASKNKNKTQAVIENIKFSINNPMTFLYHQGKGALYDGGNKTNNNLTEIRDWVSDERNQAANRWGHGTAKSIYDPCPEGWRVPDVTLTSLYSGSKGNSPWYNGYHTDWAGKPGVIQDQWHSAKDFYNGQNVGTSGWIFKGSNYKLGNYPLSGIRGELGENLNTTDRTGYWTSSLADLGTGYAIGMLLQKDLMQSGTGVYPQAAMSVRCAKDEKRLLSEPVIINPEILATPGIQTAEPQKPAQVYPNPFSDGFYVQNVEKAVFEIYDMNGRLVSKGATNGEKINAARLLKGVYVIKLTDSSGKISNLKLLKH